MAPISTDRRCLPYPLKTTTYGTGQLISTAIEHGAHLLLAIGGSATVDSGVARLARQSDTKVTVIAGQVTLLSDTYHAAGIETALACKPDSVSLDSAIANAEPLVAQTALRFAQTHLQ